MEPRNGKFDTRIRIKRGLNMTIEFGIDQVVSALAIGAFTMFIGILILYKIAKKKSVSDIVRHTTEHTSGDQPGKL
jgi:hypothetical protein